jgi:hypothetical protein
MGQENEIEEDNENEEENHKDDKHNPERALNGIIELIDAMEEWDFPDFDSSNKNLLYVIAIRNKCNLDGFKELIAQTTALTENEVMIKSFEQQVQFVPGIVPVLRRLCNYSFTKYGIKEPIITSRKNNYNII